MKQRADVVILGGGIIGCALADELARRGRRVTVLERSTIGAEASSAAAGILSAQMDVPSPGPFFDLCQAARRMYPSWIRDLERRSSVDVSYQASGVLYLAMTTQEEQRMRRRAIWQRAAGLSVERWSPLEARRNEPAVDGRIRCAFFFPREGQVDNVLLMRALAVACRRAGVDVQEQTTVERVVIRGRRVDRIETNRGVVQASVVVNCLGSWSPLLKALSMRLPVEPARGQMLSFTGPRRLFRRPVMSERAYVVQRRDGQLLVGSTVERVGFDKVLTSSGMHDILCGARRISSALGRCSFVDAWAGLRPYSRTGYPILGATPIDGVYVATGHFRHGILLAPVTATLMADLIMVGHTSFDLSRFQPSSY